MKREIKSEIVTVRLTPTERSRLDEIGGAAQVLRRALQPQSDVIPAADLTTKCSGGSFMLWANGTVGPSWPALASA